ncbi:hypothetical protein WISP_123607 [Willisornis vidua]|uniref:Reverse transcriptase domain-containing protein n=1 Tax=Willisornis vidua TaxID=1566151 RepID=A0ABQ9CXT2_9PASS|nr:hypothetical protein WISP_123607 [Willisornis vidua]
METQVWGRNTGGPGADHGLWAEMIVCLNYAIYSYRNMRNEMLFTCVGITPPKCPMVQGTHDGATPATVPVDLGQYQGELTALCQRPEKGRGSKQTWIHFCRGKSRPQPTQKIKITMKQYVSNLVSFYDRVTHLLDEGNAADVAYLDFCKAFDTISYSILPEKLAAHGLDWWVKQWRDGQAQTGSEWCDIQLAANNQWCSSGLNIGASPI